MNCRFTYKYGLIWVEVLLMKKFGGNYGDKYAMSVKHIKKY